MNFAVFMNFTTVSKMNSSISYYSKSLKFNLQSLSLRDNFKIFYFKISAILDLNLKYRY